MKASRPDDRAYPGGLEVQDQRGRLLHLGRWQAVRWLMLAVQAVLSRPLVDLGEEPVHFKIGECAHVAQGARELRFAIAETGQAPDQLDAHGCEQVEV